jgi:hypothetical protein
MFLLGESVRYKRVLLEILSGANVSQQQQDLGPKSNRNLNEKEISEFSQSAKNRTRSLMNFEVGARSKDEKIQALLEMVKFFSRHPENFLTRRIL